MRNDAGGLVCVALSDRVAEALELPFLQEVISHPTAADHDLAYDERSSFSLTVNHRDTFTGITDDDRSLTIQELAAVAADPDPDAFSDAFRSPGHVHLLRAAPDGLADRDGHTELALALAAAADHPEAASSVRCWTTSREQRSPRRRPRLRRTRRSRVRRRYGRGRTTRLIGRFPLLIANCARRLLREQRPTVWDEDSQCLSPEFTAGGLRVRGDYPPPLQVCLRCWQHMNIRTATESDTHAILRIAEQSWKTDYPEILTRETAEEAVTDWYSNRTATLRWSDRFRKDMCGADGQIPLKRLCSPGQCSVLAVRDNATLTRGGIF